MAIQLSRISASLWYTAGILYHWQGQWLHELDPKDCPWSEPHLPTPGQQQSTEHSPTYRDSTWARRSSASISRPAASYDRGCSKGADLAAAYYVIGGLFA